MGIGLNSCNRLVFLLVLFLSGFGCSKDTSPGTNEVFIEGMAYNPRTIIVPVNTAITWRNRDGTDHTVTSVDGLFDSGKIGDNGTFSTNFTVPGTYNYYCRIHPEMKGTVIVQGLTDTIPASMQ